MRRSSIQHARQQLGGSLVVRLHEVGIAGQRGETGVTGSSHHRSLIDAGTEQSGDHEVPKVVEPYPSQAAVST